MGWWARLLGSTSSQSDTGSSPMPQAAAGDGGVVIQSTADLEKYLTDGEHSATPRMVSAMQISAVQACVRLIAGGVSNAPLAIKRDVDGAKEDATGSELWTLLKRRPCPSLRPAQFLRMGTMFVLLRGEFFAYKVRSGNGHVVSMIPIHPSRCRAEEDPDQPGEVIYWYSRKSDGKLLRLSRRDILHVFLWTFDGFKGVTPIAYASGPVESSSAMEKWSSSLFKRGARVAGTLSTDKVLGERGRENVRASIAEYRAGGEKAGEELILEEGLKYAPMALSASDAQYVESRKLSKADIYEIYGIPLHMTALADKQSNWGSGVGEHNRQFIQWTLDDYFVMWEQAFQTDLIGESSDLFATFDRARLTRGDLPARTKHYTAMMQWGAMSPDEVRRDLEMNPRDDGEGGQFYPPPNMTKDDPGESDEDSNEPAERQTADDA